MRETGRRTAGCAGRRAASGLANHCTSRTACGRAHHTTRGRIGSHIFSRLPALR
jgi:hypothetical protein